MADFARVISEGVVPESTSAGNNRPYCKKCGTECQESRPYKCLTCQTPSYWACQICKKELLLQSKWEHIKHCTEDKAAKKQIARAKLAENRKKWKRSASDGSSPISEDSCSDSEYKKSKLSSDEEYTVSSESEDDCWSPESSPDSYGRAVNPVKKRLGNKGTTQCPNYVAKARALYNYEAMRKDDLSFKEGDTIFVVNKRPSGWWLGELNGKQGLIPSNYVEELPYEALAESKPRRASIDLLINHGGHSTKEVIRASLPQSSSKPGKGNTCKTVAEYEELVRLLKMELEQSQLRCRQQEDKLRDLETYKTDSVKELTYIKAVLESSLNYKQEEDAALEGLEALNGLQALF
jgi:hypothetical protein